MTFKRQDCSKQSIMLHKSAVHQHSWKRLNCRAVCEIQQLAFMSGWQSAQTAMILSHVGLISQWCARLYFLFGCMFWFFSACAWQIKSIFTDAMPFQVHFSQPWQNGRKSHIFASYAPPGSNCAWSCKLHWLTLGNAPPAMLSSLLGCLQHKSLTLACHDSQFFKIMPSTVCCCGATPLLTDLFNCS